MTSSDTSHTAKKKTASNGSVTESIRKKTSTNGAKSAAVAYSHRTPRQLHASTYMQ